MDYLNLVAPWLMHVAGHLDYANKKSGGARLDLKNASEKWNGAAREWEPGRRIPIKSPDGKDVYIDLPPKPIPDSEAYAKMAGSGFEAQDALGNIKKDPSYSLGNAIRKVLYMSGVNKSKLQDGGDIKQMEHHSGNKAINAILAATMADDFRRSRDPKSNAVLQFRVLDGGAPGAVLSVPLDADMRPVWRGK